MIKITESCTGCFACVSICPLQSISLQVNEFGELHPHDRPRQNVWIVGCALKYVQLIPPFEE